MACSNPKRVRLNRDNNNGSGSDSASDHDDGSDDDVVDDMKMEELEQQNETNRGNNNIDNNNNNIDNNNNNINNNNNHDNNNNDNNNGNNGWVSRILANLTDNICLCLIVEYSKPCDVLRNLLHVSQNIYQKLIQEPNDFFILGAKNVTVTLAAITEKEKIDIVKQEFTKIATRGPRWTLDGKTIKPQKIQQIKQQINRSIKSNKENNKVVLLNAQLKPNGERIGGAGKKPSIFYLLRGTQLNNTQIANIMKMVLDRSDYPKQVQV